MGYRSDIRIVTSVEGFKQLSEFVKNYLKEKKLNAEEYNLLENLEVKVEGKEQCYFGWNYLKWYDGYPDVDAIMEGLDYLGENEYSYKYMRIGESYDDCEEQYYDGIKEDNIELAYPNMIREFDDDYIKDLIQDIQLDNLEENKESIDI